MIRDHVMMFTRDYPEFSEDVSEFVRFPEGVIYINGSYMLCGYILGLLRAADLPKSIVGEELVKAKDIYYDHLEKIFNIIDTTETHKLYEYGCFDQESFERKYNLTWLDDDRSWIMIIKNVGELMKISWFLWILMLNK